MTTIYLAMKWIGPPGGFDETAAARRATHPFPDSCGGICGSLITRLARNTSYSAPERDNRDTKPVPVVPVVWVVPVVPVVSLVSVVPVVPVVSAQSKSQSAFVQTPRAEPISFAEARLREMLSPLNCRF